MLDELREVLGDVALIRFIGVFGGTRVSINSGRAEVAFREIERVIGADAHAKLRARFDGERIHVPVMASLERGARNNEIAARLASGETPRAVARSLRLSEFHIRRIAKTVG